MKKALAGLRVLDCGSGIASAYAAKLMADLGADVVKVEPPEGDRTRRAGPFPGGQPDPDSSALFHYLNSNKRGVALDLAVAAERERFDALAREAHALVHDLPLGSAQGAWLDCERLAGVNPQLVSAHIAPFGDTGPHATFQATDIVALSAGGMTKICASQPGTPTEEPMRPFGDQSEFQGGLHAAFALLGAVVAANNRGDGDCVELSAQETITAILATAIAAYTYNGHVASRHGTRSLQPWAIMNCADGRILIFCVENAEWDRLVDILGNPEWASWDIFRDRFDRGISWDVLKPLLEEEIGKWKVRDLYEAAQRQRVPLSPVSTMADLLESPQLGYRKFFTTSPDSRFGDARFPGAPYRLSETPWAFETPAPAFTRDLASVPAFEPTPGLPRFGGPVRPLEGIRVIDFTWVWAGPYCAMHLAHLGAEVIKVESETRLDTTRRFQPFLAEIPGVNRSGYFNQYNQGKRSVTLNLGTEEGRRLAKALCLTADVVMDNFAPGAMKRLGLDHDVLSAIRPDIITVSLSGYGDDGPESKYISYGPTQEPLTGMSELSGRVGGPPADMGLSYGDPVAGIHGAFATVAALWHRAAGGSGQHIDCALFESTVCVIPQGVLGQSVAGRQPERQGNRDRTMAPHGMFPATGEDNWVAIACRDDADYRALCGAMGQPALADDPRFATLPDRKANEDELEAIVREWTAPQGRWEVTRQLQSLGIPAFPVMTTEDLANDAHLDERGFFVRFPHAEVGDRPHAGAPFRARKADIGPRAAAPLLGEANTYVLEGILGLDHATVDQLIGAAVVH
ncbi:MAG: CoA transferase [Dehalococcoidia bacterium]|nr:CoA transferase [Dehalococcoidia bacterium]